ncbi:hypothetical protein K2173_013768 [Erythroxylum novogranatense]|uniref:Phytocyanin domain-containing protein n=1 Tax=Erythroxylum novogranatense TaxID=1862640 RepID=A0AAV8SCT9_9ROSI|nr:hypothetical protein K2173_013768 [Erythroxylum novogranatense]
MEVALSFRRCIFWLMVMTIMAVGECRNVSLHYVGGGKTTWAPGIDFAKWSSNETFYAGDWLYFGFDKHKYTVFSVNETSYDKCEWKGFIKNVTRGGRDVFQLVDPITYYFIDGSGYCEKGMKVATTAINSPDSAPAPNALPPNAAHPFAPTPAPAENNAFSYLNSYLHHMVFALMVTCFFLLS